VVVKSRLVEDLPIFRIIRRRASMLKAFCFAVLALCALPARLLAQERYLVSYAGFGGFQAPAWAAKDFGFFTKYA
jgi:ABC-type nitrate/sulfonate/bicarbonate transport system substrate-binding protein